MPGRVIVSFAKETMMMPRLNYATAAPDAVRPMFAANAYLAKSTLEPTLQAFVSIRASQINGCALCLAMHWREAVELGENGDRLHGLPVWREASWYSPRERAALEWTETLTTIAGKHVEDDLYARVREQFSDEEMVALTVAVNAINNWNRLNIAFRVPPELAEQVLAQYHPAAAR
jgi:AhpD family alkylhydroperoxidase